MKYYLFTFFAILLVFTRFSSLNAIQCRVCSEESSCSSALHPSEWQLEECPASDHNCNLVWEKTEAGHIKLVSGGCSNNRINYCSKDTENNSICISTCEGNLCNESINF